MALELRQSLSLHQQLVMTPQLQQAIKLLQLSRLELLEVISQEMEENPVLEEHAPGEADQEGEEVPGPEEPVRETPGVSEVRVEERARDDVDWETYITEYNTGWAETQYEERELPSFENLTDTRADLSQHLMWQLNMSSLGDDQREIGVHIIGNLNEDGYLDISIEELMEITGQSRDRVLETLRMIQNFDPVGVAAQDTQECLLIQVRFHNLGGSLVERIIRDHMKDLENRAYDRIAGALSLTMDEVASAVSVIQSLDPRPGRMYAREETIYITPDI